MQQPSPRHNVIELRRDLVRIRGTYCYESILSLDAALEDLRETIEHSAAEPLAVTCCLAGDATLEISITVPMFTDHTYAARWCDLLASTAWWADHDVEVVQL